MNIRILLILLTLFFGGKLLSQGVSFSYLIPKNGYLSAPVSPFSIRGIGIGSTVGVETGATLYNIPGLGMDHLPFDSNKPLVGPHFALLVPLEAFLKLPLGSVNIKFMAGGFGWWNINPRLNEGNMDRAFRTYEGWDVLNTHFSMENKLGIGWLAGLELEFRVNDRFSITTECQYLKGAANTALTGSYSGATSAGDFHTQSIDIPDAAILLQGLELSVGVKFSR